MRRRWYIKTISRIYDLRTFNFLNFFLQFRISRFNSRALWQRALRWRRRPRAVHQRDRRYPNVCRHTAAIWTSSRPALTIRWSKAASKRTCGCARSAAGCHVTQHQSMDVATSSAKAAYASTTWWRSGPTSTSSPSKRRAARTATRSFITASWSLGTWWTRGRRWCIRRSRSRVLSAAASSARRSKQTSTSSMYARCVQSNVRTADAHSWTALSASNGSTTRTARSSDSTVQSAAFRCNIRSGARTTALPHCKHHSKVYFNDKFLNLHLISFYFLNQMHTPYSKFLIVPPNSFF